MNDNRRIRPGGLVIALTGFAITRLFVAEALVIDAALPFLLVGLLPLLVGLSLAVYGVALAIGPFTATYVNTIARWHVLGVAAMAVVFAITALDQFLRGETLGFGNGTSILVANVLLGGAVGGTLTGMRSGKAHQQRQELRRAANRALLVHRLLKHDVLNAIAIIGGHAELLDTEGDVRPESVSAIRRAVQRIDSSVGEVGTIARSEDRSKRVDVERIVREERRRFESDTETVVSLTTDIDGAEVPADDRLAVVVRELLGNAATHGSGGEVDVHVRGMPHTVEVSVTDDGPGLPTRQRAVVERGEFPEFDDPAAGFGLQIVRLLVVQFGGQIHVRDGDDGRETGTSVTVVLPRSGRGEVTAETIGISFPGLEHAITGGLLGGVAMGGFYHFFTGLLPVVGSLYGIQSPVIGWITHLFHSAVFGLLFGAAINVPRLAEIAADPIRSGLLGIGWGAFLWLVAAGIVMPVWLTLSGVPTAIPTLSPAGFLAHAVWGAVLGVSYWTLGELDVPSPLRRE
ncbi:ATP-binding protein [Halobellus sp. GM3]|uniref:ATP-binding protein n=1 Tax=Halobellus sp. GM3 TaxID=3458410 RepID=UPI00403D6E6A